MVHQTGFCDMHRQCARKVGFWTNTERQPRHDGNTQVTDVHSVIGYDYLTRTNHTTRFLNHLHMYIAKNTCCNVSKSCQVTFTKTYYCPGQHASHAKKSTEPSFIHSKFKVLVTWFSHILHRFQYDRSKDRCKNQYSPGWNKTEMKARTNGNNIGATKVWLPAEKYVLVWRRQRLYYYANEQQFHQRLAAVSEQCRSPETEPFYAADMT